MELAKAVEYERRVRSVERVSEEQAWLSFRTQPECCIGMRPMAGTMCLDTIMR